MVPPGLCPFSNSLLRAIHHSVNKFVFLGGYRQGTASLWFITVTFKWSHRDLSTFPIDPFTQIISISLYVVFFFEFYPFILLQENYDSRPLSTSTSLLIRNPPIYCRNQIDINPNYRTSKQTSFNRFSMSAMQSLLGIFFRCSNSS